MAQGNIPQYARASPDCLLKVT